jgi:hypothetical protein
MSGRLLPVGQHAVTSALRSLGPISSRWRFSSLQVCSASWFSSHSFAAPPAQRGPAFGACRPVALLPLCWWSSVMLPLTCWLRSRCALTVLCTPGSEFLSSFMSRVVLRASACLCAPVCFFVRVCRAGYLYMLHESHLAWWRTLFHARFALTSRTPTHPHTHSYIYIYIYAYAHTHIHTHTHPYITHTLFSPRFLSALKSTSPHSFSIVAALYLS